MTNWERVRDRFTLERDKAMVKCPCHRDEQASLSLKRNGDDVLMFCFAGCSWADLRTELGLQRQVASVPAGPHAFNTPRRRVVAEYAYRDLVGDVIAVKSRWEPKTFTWSTLRPDGQMRSGFAEGQSQADLPLYHLPEAVRAGERGGLIAITEGEKDADAMNAIGLIAVTNPGGASKAGDSYDIKRYLPHFAPDRVTFCILPDNDDAGRAHAQTLAAALGVAFAVHVLHLPDLPAKGDVSDWLALHRADDDDGAALAQTLGQLMLHAPPWTPAPPHVMAVDAHRDALHDERAGFLMGQDGWTHADITRVSQHQATTQHAVALARLNGAERLLLTTEDAETRSILAALARR